MINGRNDRRQLVSDLLRSGNTFGLCTISVIEVHSGMRAGEEGITREYIDGLLYYDVSKLIAERAGAIRSRWRQKGYSLFLANATIASVALFHGLPLLTDNRKHFPMAELQLYPLP